MTFVPVPPSGSAPCWMARSTDGAEVVHVRHIVVGIDGSKSAAAALDLAIEEARLHDAALEVWAVLEPSPHGLDEAEAVANEEAFVEGLRGVVADIGSDVSTQFRVGRGGAAAVLCKACADTDLLVVGSRGRGPFAGLLLGSVSRACLQHAPCSVAVVRPEAPATTAHGRVVVGVDTSSDSRHALHVAAKEAHLRGAELHAVHAVHWDHLGGELIEPTTEQLVTWGERLVTKELAETGVIAHTVVASGTPPDVLVRHSADADLLVLGSRGHNPLAALALGSTSDHCVRHAACPVMVVRPGDVRTG